MNIILFTGLSASGKSTISKEVSKKLDLPRIDIHAIIHDIALQKGFPRARNWILETGIPRALEETRESLVKETENARNREGVIIDEVLDPETFDLLKHRFAEDEFCTVYIKTNRHDRKRFMANRLGKKTKEAKREIRFIDGLKERVGTRDIIEAADYKFENFGTLEDIAYEIAKTLQQEILGEKREVHVHGEREF